MTVLSYQTIKQLCQEENLISPWLEKGVYNGKSFGLSECGYDIRIKQTIIIYPCNFWTWFCNLCRSKDKQLKSFVLASTIEHFNIPIWLKMDIYDKSSWAREGLTVQNTMAEPGWTGYLTIELSNHGSKKLIIQAGTPIAQVVFVMLDKPTEKPYKGKYNKQPDRPVASIYQLE